MIAFLIQLYVIYFVIVSNLTLVFLVYNTLKFMRLYDETEFTEANLLDKSPLTT